MRLRKGADIIRPRKKIGLFVSAAVRHKGMISALCHVSMNEMLRVRTQAPKKEKFLGLPHLISLNRNSGEVHFFPAADKNVTVDLYYHPPVDKM